MTPPADQPPPAAPEQPAPTPPPVEPPPPAKEAPHPPKNLEPLPKDDAVTVLGKKVRGPAGEDMGRVVDLLLDRDAQPRAVVIDFGGFLGVGSRKIAIDWRLVRFVPDDRDAPLALSLGKAEVQAAPEYKDTAQPPVMVGQPPPILMPLDSDLPPVVSPETADGTQKALYASAARGLDGLNLIARISRPASARSSPFS
ncbi:MAG: PRC-barrel domain-containing protein [Aliidongia sp.]